MFLTVEGQQMQSALTEPVSSDDPTGQAGENPEQLRTAALVSRSPLN